MTKRNKVLQYLVHPRNELFFDSAFVRLMAQVSGWVDGCVRTSDHHSVGGSKDAVRGDIILESTPYLSSPRSTSFD